MVEPQWAAGYTNAMQTLPILGTQSSLEAEGIAEGVHEPLAEAFRCSHEAAMAACLPCKSGPHQVPCQSA